MLLRREGGFLRRGGGFLRRGGGSEEDDALKKRGRVLKKRGRVLKSGKEKAHKHKQTFPVTARAGGGSPDRVGGSPDRWPRVKSLCAVCGTQGT